MRFRIGFSFGPKQILAVLGFLGAIAAALLGTGVITV